MQRMRSGWRFLGLAGVLWATLVGCTAKGDPSQRIPTELIPAAAKHSAAGTPPKTLIVVLPGRADTVAGLRRSGVVQAVQSVWPGADVQLTGLAMDYYMAGRAIDRLHDEIIAPARPRYGEIWLVGASLGGMGALMYDREHPDVAAGIVLLAPYLGEQPLLDEIAAAGGLQAWSAGPRPSVIDNDNFQRELWRHLQSLGRDPKRASRLWLAYGEGDKLRTAQPLIASILPANHVLLRPGGHSWSVWSPVTREILRAARR